MADLVEVIVTSTNVVEIISPGGNIVETLPTTVAVVEVVTQGPQGTAGAAGNFFEVEFIAVANGAQSIPVTYPPTAFQLLTINGLQQSAADYSVSGTTLNLPAGLGVLAGDKIHFTFSRS